MINFRFHLVSVVAVFLALGIGVAMGASFIDRATVETMRGRLDQLETNYRERGDEIDSLRGQVEELDRDASRLIEDGSLLLADRLEGTTVMTLSIEGTPPAGMEATRSALDAADADDGGSLVVDLERLGADAGTLDDVRELVDLSVAAPVRVRERVLTTLGDALGVLALGAPASPAEPLPTPQEEDPPLVEGPGSVETAPPDDPSPASGDASDDPELATPPEHLEAEAFVRELVRIGVVRLEPSELASAALFGPEPLRFVLVVDPELAVPAGLDGAGAEPGLRDLSQALATAAPAVLTVAEPAAVRPSGDAVDRDRSTGQLVTELRDDTTSAGLLSTIDHLDEVMGRLALVLAVEEQVAGRVGHYGSGEGATSTLPHAPE